MTIPPRGSVSLRALALVSLALTACSTDGRTPYYDEGGTPPSISGVDGQAYELGNLGGGTLTITGSGFGADAAEVVVQFGSQNAEIVAVSDSAIEVITPRGPIEGGSVDVKVATATGQTSFEDLFTYEVGEIYDEQDAYILVNNFWYSCFGGRDTLDINAGCETISYIGNTGTDGYAEFFDFSFPRKHSPSYGWFGGADWSPGEWSTEVPAYRPFASGVDNLRLTVDNFNLHNRQLEGSGWCVDTSVLGSWYYGGSDETDPTTYSAEGSLLSPATTSQVECDALPNGRWYALADLNFCEVQEYEENHSNDYQADWPIGLPFFVPAGEGAASDDSPEERLRSCRNGLDEDGDGFTDGQDEDCHPVIAIENADAGLNGVELRLPEPVRFQAEQGFDIDPGAEDIWPLLPLEGCFDDDGDGSTELSDTAMRIVWEPSGFEPSTSNSFVLGVETHIRISLSTLTLGWFGGEAQPFRSTITVPDDFNYDEGTGLSSVDLPVEIFYQVPNIGFPNGVGTCEEQFGSLRCTWGDPALNDYGYLIVSADRVTEYRLESTLPGDLVFAYVTGDFGFQDWAHPYTEGGCGDCFDNDGDGWTDDLDADCEDGQGEENGLSDGTGVYTCSDGRDNDGDGDVDAEDDDCESGFDRETDCGNGIDDDGDGWTDDLDGECAAVDGSEAGDDDEAWTCSNGLDDDGDGWFDSDDPGCTSGADDELLEVYSGSACNDGIDNDGHGDPDAEDPLCITRGASHTTEEPTYVDQCIDGVENESGGDGYVDLFDPDCEYSPFWRENSSSHDVTSRPGTKECYNGEDDDGDGLTDADDPGCWQLNTDRGWIYIPDGFLDDEAADDGSCSDGIDNDGDGAMDFDDVDDCIPGLYDPANGNSPGDNSERTSN